MRGYLNSLLGALKSGRGDVPFMQAAFGAEALPLFIWSWLLLGGFVFFKVVFCPGHYRNMHQADSSGRTLKNTT